MVPEPASVWWQGNIGDNDTPGCLKLRRLVIEDVLMRKRVIWVKQKKITQALAFK
jgi:hypothetical protein